MPGDLLTAVRVETTTIVGERAGGDRGEEESGELHGKDTGRERRVVWGDKGKRGAAEETAEVEGREKKRSEPRRWGVST